MAATIHMQPTIVPQINHPPPQQPPPPPPNLTTVKGLAVTQLVIGILTVIFGIAVVSRLYEEVWTTNTGAGVWAGIWIIITGIIGLCSVKDYNNRCLNGLYLAFSIVSTCVAFLAGLFFIIGTALFATHCYEYQTHLFFYKDCKSRRIGLGLHIPLLIIMIVEFFISIIASVYCCQRGCGSRVGGAVIVQHSQVMMVPQTGGVATLYPTNPLHYPQYSGSALPQYGGQVMQHYVVQAPPQYNMQAPPGYNEHPYMGKPPEYTVR